MFQLLRAAMLAQKSVCTVDGDGEACEQVVDRMRIFEFPEIYHVTKQNPWESLLSIIHENYVSVESNKLRPNNVCSLTM